MVAVKVRHPGVSQAIQRDFALMMRMARIASLVPFIRELRLEDTLAQFAAPLREQVCASAHSEHMHPHRLGECRGEGWTIDFWPRFWVRTSMLLTCMLSPYWLLRSLHLQQEVHVSARHFYGHCDDLNTRCPAGHCGIV